MNKHEFENGAPVRPAVAEVTPPTLMDGRRVPLSTDLSGSVRVALSSPAGMPLSASSQVSDAEQRRLLEYAQSQREALLFNSLDPTRGYEVR